MNKTQKSNYCVYKHIFPSGKVYIGLTCQKPEKRWANGRGYKNCHLIFNAIKKYGWENVKHEIIKTNLTKSEAERLEIELIKEFHSNDKKHGYNIENGGNCTGTHSESTKRKISKANKGKIVSEETRKKLSVANTGNFVGEKNPFYGKHHSEKVKKEHSLFMRGNKYNKGNHHTESFRYMKSKQMHEKYKDGGNPRCKKVAFTNGEKTTIYYSLREAARQFNVNPSTIYNYINDTNNENWRYSCG